MSYQDCLAEPGQIHRILAQNENLARETLQRITSAQRQIDDLKRRLVSRRTTKSGDRSEADILRRIAPIQERLAETEARRAALETTLRNIQSEVTRLKSEAGSKELECELMNDKEQSPSRQNAPLSEGVSTRDREAETNRLHRLIASPEYWRDHRPAVVDDVRRGYEGLFPDDAQIPVQ